MEIKKSGAITSIINEITEHFFNTKGIKVAAGEIIKLTAQHGNNASNNDYEAKLELWEETTESTPVI